MNSEGVSDDEARRCLVPSISNYADGAAFMFQGLLFVLLFVFI